MVHPSGITILYVCPWTIITCLILTTFNDSISSGCRSYPRILVSGSRTPTGPYLQCHEVSGVAVRCVTTSARPCPLPCGRTSPANSGDQDDRAVTIIQTTQRLTARQTRPDVLAQGGMIAGCGAEQGGGGGGLRGPWAGAIG